MSKPLHNLKVTRVQVRFTLAEHNALMGEAVTNSCTLSQVIRRRLNLHSVAGKETGNAGAQPVSGL